MINGQIAPKITMYPGEIQRWRFIAMTIDATTQLEIDFDGESGPGAEALGARTNGHEDRGMMLSVQTVCANEKHGRVRVDAASTTRIIAGFRGSLRFAA